MNKKPEPFDPSIRDALAEAVGRYGLRAMARDVSMSPSGLSKYLGGTEPYAPTRRRLLAWKAAWGTEEPLRVREEAVTQLIRTFPTHKQSEVRREVAELLARHSEPRRRARRRR